MFVIKCDKCNSVDIKEMGRLFICMNCLTVIGIDRFRLEDNLKELPTFDVEEKYLKENNKEVNDD